MIVPESRVAMAPRPLSSATFAHVNFIIHIVFFSFFSRKKFLLFFFFLYFFQICFIAGIGIRV